MPEIETFMEPDGDKYTMHRAAYTWDFIQRHVNMTGELRVLDIGPSSPVSRYLSEELCARIKHTSGDLDWTWTAPEGSYNLVTCLEVIEHLMSPKYFLLRLRDYLDPEGSLIISYPSRPKWLWTPLHFHEYDRKRFTYLVENCGYRIVRWERRYFPTPWYRPFTGVRPFFRSWVNWDNLVLLNLTVKTCN